LEELSIDHHDPDAEICSIEASDLDLIDELLQTNCMSISLQEFHKDAEQNVEQWTLENRLLKYTDCLVVTPDNNLQTRLIKEAYIQISTAYLEKTKTCKIIEN
jgi:rRNA-processing protein FCF1